VPVITIIDGINNEQVGRVIQFACGKWLFIAGMWFQDLFNYGIRRREQCIIPYTTQEGEISFCIVEKMHITATLTKWYEEHEEAGSFGD